MKKIKILHIIKTLNLGGAETNLLNLIKNTDKEKYEIHVGYSFGGELENSFIRAGARLFKYAAESHRVKSLASIPIILRIWWYLLVNRIDVIHTHNFSGHIWGAVAAKLAGKKIVEHVHDFRYFDPQDFARRRGFNNQFNYTKYLKNISDRVIVLTKQNRDFLIDGQYYPVDKVVELQNGIPITPLVLDDLEQTAFKARNAIKPFGQVVFTPVRVAPEKNVDLILRIAPKVIAQVPDVVFVIAGDGPLLAECQAEVDAKKLNEWIKFVGFRPDIRNFLAASDVMLLPSFLELHSIAILEAMSMKVPVVVSQDVGCNSEFIENGKNGMLCDPFFDAGWAEAIIKLLKDKDFRISVGEEGYKTCVEKFDIIKTVRHIENIYEEPFRVVK